MNKTLFIVLVGFILLGSLMVSARSLPKKNGSNWVSKWGKYTANETQYRLNESRRRLGIQRDRLLKVANKTCNGTKSPEEMDAWVERRLSNLKKQIDANIEREIKEIQRAQAQRRRRKQEEGKRRLNNGSIVNKTANKLRKWWNGHKMRNQNKSGNNTNKNTLNSTKKNRLGWLSRNRRNRNANNNNSSNGNNNRNRNNTKNNNTNQKNTTQSNSFARSGVELDTSAKGIN
eukprot:TRINITY_DN8085_c0_g1_i1.p1 TRINITY_DN8085_c0_g1~~TRINITY_DN8085_c0_g1_i1.p1  ORF type:complete len:231 (-),score=47.49 TRINITY_DN8085_c0_g1_i1:95-787(-)